ncbi:MULTISPECIES: ATP-dependent nuclease [Mesorhizobium]|uniref:Uncharacterized protein n=2 Tax=Mesorhizobium TaxID=68287 RepID=A0A1A5IMA6_RHILI|nr:MULTISPECIES: AAA family ATPase [Mesorhizobium]MBE1710933.1 AAA family ATPase [Mesorhizobium japonicum]MBE1715399.1 AAA family ATPase [Mesorhizobium japonicum]OBP78867.1 hypothetical protein BAE39_29060 [Mesorhizobium loti]OBP80106.1 hypothetical protein BAE42_00010 [Mesorhizobium loti]OBP84552.1 hypothetical protein BAE38_24140 [Mesorhizobium loti]
MYIESLTIRNFRCYGDVPVKIDLLPGTNAFVGTNGSGKTAALEAVKRLFSPLASERQIRRSDIHFGLGEDALTLQRREVVIDIVFGFSAAEPGVSAFNDLFFNAADSSLKVRIVLEALYVRSESNEDNIEIKTYSVNTTENVPFGPDDERKSPLGNRTTQYAEVVYIPAHRDSRGVSQFALKNVLQRLELSADWTEETKTKSQNFATELEKNLSATDAIAEVTTKLGGFWSALHDGHYDASPRISVVAVEFEKLIRELTLKFDKSPGGGMRQLHELSEGQMSLLYFALSATLHNIVWEMQKALPKALKGFKIADFVHPPLTIFALEEPENHLSPFYLPRLMKLLDTLNASGAAQSIVTSHATSILSRVVPRKVVYFRNNAQTLQSSAVHLPLPPLGSNEDKFVQQVILANPEVYFARLVVIGEGDTERVVIPRMAEAFDKSLDPSFIAYVSIGGRHAQHLWRLLNGLGIPNLTLLDFDLGRFGGGMGRIRNAVSWLTDLGPAHVPQLVIPDTNPPQNIPATVAQIPSNADLNPATYQDWALWLRASGVYYSTAVDLDMMMLKAFPEAYVADKTFDAKAENSAKLATAVFGESGLGNAELGLVGQTCTDTELFQYKALFKSSSKPGSHLEAFSKLPFEELRKRCPEPLQALIHKATELIARAKVGEKGVA